MVAVDEILGTRECVLKPVAHPRGAPRVAVGATVLESGAVALVLDVPVLTARLATLSGTRTLAS